MCVFLLSQIHAAVPPVIISEFMAENNGFLRDSFGNASDWLELQNTTGRAIDLTGWALTDAADERDKWIIQGLVLPPWGTRLIWASNADLRDPSGELHTNFALSKKGEYLGLYDADHMLVHDFGAAFPPQYENVAYGYALSLVQETVDLVSSTSPVKAFCPPDGTLGATWRAPAFDDSGWLAGFLPAGYATKSPAWATEINLSLLAIAQGKPGLFLRIPFTLADAAAVLSLTLTMTYDDGAAVYLNGTYAGGANTPPFAALSYTNYAASIINDPVTLADADLTASAPVLSCGENMMAVHLMNCNATSSDIFFKPSLQALCQTLVATNEPTYLVTATPGTFNPDASNQHLTQTVLFSRDAGIVTAAFSLTLTGAGAGQTIRYTTDGSEPSLTNSVLYSEPFLVASSSHFRAKVFDAVGHCGVTSTAQYTFPATDSATLTFATALPILVIRETDPLTNGLPTVESTNDTACTAHLIEPLGGWACLTSPATLTSRVGIHIRGSSSSGFPKKPYTVTFWGEDNDDRDVELAGFPAGSDFALISCWSYDRTYMHDALMFSLSRQIGRYAPRTRWVELFLIGDPTSSLSAARYQGLYVLEERVKAGDDRLPVDDVVSPADTAQPNLSGSYIFKADRNDADEFYWRTAHNFPNSAGRYMVLYRPKLADVTPEQSLYIVNAFNDFENTVYGTDPMNPETGVGQYIDLLSFVDFHILKMYSMDVDIFTLSSYFHKDRGGKIMAGPVWDFDRSLGPYGYSEATYPNVKRWDAWTFASEPFIRSDFWGKLHAQRAFQRLYWDRWSELRRGAFSNTRLASTIAGLKAGLPDAAATRDYVKWNTWPTNDVFGRTHSGEVAWLTWFATNHATWIDQNLFAKCALLAAPRLEPGVREAPAGSVVNVTLTATEGDTLYFTLDGSDPALWNDQPNPAARMCQPGMTIQLAASATLFARAYDSATARWSLAARGEFLIGGHHARPGDVLLSEIHYHPAVCDVPPLPETTSRCYEFVEIVNVAECDISLKGCRFPEGEPADALTLDGPILKPGEHAVIARHPEAFAKRYGSGVTPIACWLYGGLSDSGETVTLLNEQGLLLDRIAYKTSGAWAKSADGRGDSLNRLTFTPCASAGDAWMAALPTPGQGGYAEWSGRLGLCGALDGDDDGDGVANLLEYYSGSDPLDPRDRGIAGVCGLETGCDGFRLTFRQAYGRPDVWASVQESDDLLEWSDMALTDFAAADLGDGFLWTCRLTDENTPACPRRFFRFVVRQADSASLGGAQPTLLP